MDRGQESISDDVADWGLTLKSVEIQDIKPSPSMQASMEKQAAAERERKAAVTKAEGEKQAAMRTWRRSAYQPRRHPLNPPSNCRRRPRRAGGSSTRLARPPRKGVRLSYGLIERIAPEAEKQAAGFNANTCSGGTG